MSFQQPLGEAVVRISDAEPNGPGGSSLSQRLKPTPSFFIGEGTFRGPRTNIFMVGENRTFRQPEPAIQAGPDSYR